MHQLKRYFALAMCILLLALPALAGADFGDFSSSSDFGSWSSGGSDFSSWGSDDYDSYDSGSTYYYYDGSDGDYEEDDDSFFSLIGFTMLLIIIVAVWITAADHVKKKKNASRPEGARRTDASRLSPLADLKANDPAFNEATLTEKLSNLYMQMQSCWTAKDIAPLEPYFTDAFFTQLERQLEGQKKRGVTNYIERIAVLGVELRGFFTEGGEQHLIAELRTRIVDYTLEDKSGQLVSGDRKKEKFMTYEWELTRAEGSKTDESTGVKSIACPGCGAPLSINTTARCEYCGRVVTLNHADWAISAIRAISQQTV